MVHPIRHQGFTLLEIIVVIVLFSLITTIAMQGISYVLGQKARMAQFQQELIQTTLRHQWFIESTSQLFVPPEDAGYQLRGSAESFSGYTASPLIRPEYASKYITWTLNRTDADVSLIYSQANDDLARSENPLLLFSRISGDAYFRYMDGNGQFHEQWPPVVGTGQNVAFTALPEGIYLYAESADGVELSWFVRLHNAKIPKVTERFSE